MAVSPQTYFQVLTKGLESSLATTPVVEGKLRYTTDTGRLYMDLNNNTRIRISDVIYEYTESYILNDILAPLQKIYVASDTGRAYIYINDAWVNIGPIKVTAASGSSDLMIWMSDGTDGDEANYATGLKYNPSTNTFKTPNAEVSTKLSVGDLEITDTEDQSTGYHTVLFALPTPEAES